MKKIPTDTKLDTKSITNKSLDNLISVVATSLVYLLKKLLIIPKINSKNIYSITGTKYIFQGLSFFFNKINKARLPAISKNIDKYKNTVIYLDTGSL